MKFNVSLDLLEEMAECIHISNWASTDEIYAYMKSCVTGSADYDPEDYADGKDPKQPIEAEPLVPPTRFEQCTVTEEMGDGSVVLTE